MTLEPASQDALPLKGRENKTECTYEIQNSKDLDQSDGNVTTELLSHVSASMPDHHITKGQHIY